jgi:hypothetical protein
MDEKIDKILFLIDRIEKIRCASNNLSYDEELRESIPEIFKTLGAAREACIAELKSL